MAKAIKFNLICDDMPIRTIEDLQNNFSVEDVLAYYNNKLLHRWLEVRGYAEELAKVSAITVEKPIEIVKELIKIFSVVCDDKKIEESVYMLEYLEERKELCSIYEKQSYRAQSIIDDYETGYRQLVEGILENPNDVAKIKANIAEMVMKYKWVLDLNHRALFWTLKEKSALAVMCLLMNEKSREYYVPIESKKEDGVVTIDIDTNVEKRNMFNSISVIIKKSDFSTKLGDNLITFAGITDGYWKDLEPKGKKFMIISMGTGDFVRSAGVSGGDLASTDVTNKFVIVDGIDYKSNSSTRELLYMEV
ncbi:hypothetical protein [Anaerotignum sp.]|uniref:hypothetical protein n=1 Tax=Anaerotignum sp. TaxID=2039241 RepID=UPI00289D762A|nr:hypothetical protein [Anaerotignum sp.]